MMASLVAAFIELREIGAVKDWRRPVRRNPFTRSMVARTPTIAPLMSMMKIRTLE
jgi:hypothetical protein